MDDVLRCHGCGLPVDLTDDVANVAGRRFHQMCASAPHTDAGGRPSGLLGRFDGLVKLGWVRGR